VRIAIISDTHMPRRARRVPDACVEAMRSADCIVHAGDLSSIEVLDWLESLGPPVHAVHGNVDTAEVQARLPHTTSIDAGKIKLAVIHDAGPAKGRLSRMRRRFPDVDAVVFGHSHLPLHESADGLQIFNPGSPTERRRAPRHSFGIAEADGNSLRMRHVWLT
jgi:putative phosphoesterase